MLPEPVISPWTVQNLLLIIPVIGTTLATLIISLLNWQKNNKIHVLVNSGRSEMLRELLSVRVHIAKLSGKPEDALLAEQALKNLEEADRLNKAADKV